MLFDRIIQVSIGKPGTTGTAFENIKISFEGEKSNSRWANKCTVNLYNIQDDTIDRLNDDDNVLILYAGYVEHEGLQFLFSGDITRILPVYEPPNRVLKIECFDGLKKLQEKRTVVSFVPGTLVDTIVKKFVRIIDLPLSQNYTPITETYNNGFAFVGEARKGLTKVLDRVNKQWSIQNGSILIIDDDTEATRKEIVRLAPDSGLIGIPESLNEDEGRLSSRRRRKRRYKVKSLLRPDVGIYDKIFIESSVVEGIYKVVKHSYSGSNYENDWISTFEIRER